MDRDREVAGEWKETEESETQFSAGTELPEVGPYEAVRGGVGFIDTSLLTSIVRVSGEGALEFLDRILPGKLAFLQPYCALMTPVLDENIRLLDFIYVLNLEDSYLLFVSPVAQARMREFLDTHRTPGVEVECVDEQWTSFLVEGPYAWKVAKDVVGPEVIGLRFLYAMEFTLSGEKAYCLRSGMTGEYGYRFIVPRGSLGELLEKLDANQEFSCAPIPLHELNVLCHETRMPVFGITLRAGDCPFETGIRYSIDFRKESFVYYAALIRRRDEALRGLVGFELEGAIAGGAEAMAGQPVKLEGATIGQLRYVGFSPTLGKHFGFAFLSRELAYPGLKSQVGDYTLNTASTPFFHTRSLDVAVE